MLIAKQNHQEHYSPQSNESIPWFRSSCTEIRWGHLILRDISMSSQRRLWLCSWTNRCELNVRTKLINTTCSQKSTQHPVNSLCHGDSMQWWGGHQAASPNTIVLQLDHALCISLFIYVILTICHESRVGIIYEFTVIQKINFAESLNNSNIAENWIKRIRLNFRDGILQWLQ